MQGTKIELARRRLGLSKTGLARILGVGPSTVYRWENRLKPPIDPFHERLLTIVIDVAESPRPSDLGWELEKMSEDDPMRALYMLLGMAFNDWTKQDA